VKDAVVVLKNPKLDGDNLTFNVQTLDGDLNGAVMDLLRSSSAFSGSGAERLFGARCMLALPRLSERLLMLRPTPTAAPRAAITPIRIATEGIEKEGARSATQYATARESCLL